MRFSLRSITGRAAARLDSSISAEIVGTLVFIAKELKVDPKKISEVFASQHYRQMPSQQLSARLYAAFKQRLRRKADAMPTTEDKRETKYSGLMFDIKHVSTYAPYCDAYFADKWMAHLMEDSRVSVEKTFGCKVFSSSSIQQLYQWLDDLKATMRQQHKIDLAWAYPKYRDWLK
jgi:hypothetical protein